MHSSVIYGPGHDYGLMSTCVNYPKCDAYAGKGATLANMKLRTLRKRCHALFDKKWKSGQWTRKACYHWLQKVMNLPPALAHIALFRDEQCEKLLEIMDPNAALIRNIKK